MTFETERLILRPWELSDADSLYEYAKDPQVGLSTGFPPHKSVEESLEIIRTVLIPNGDFAICRKEDNIAIGCLGIIDRPRSKYAVQSEVELGFWLGVPFWGKGYMPEAVAEIQKYLFTETDITGIWCGYAEGNIKSKRCQEKCGFLYVYTNENVHNNKLNEDRNINMSYLSRIRWLDLQNSDEVWDYMYREALKVQNDREISKTVWAGGVAAAVLSESGKIYTGVCVDTACTLGICAERNAMFNMLTNGENKIKKVLAVMGSGRVGPPCGACREFMVQLMPNDYKNVQIMLDYEQRRGVTLGELTPDWWI